MKDARGKVLYVGKAQSLRNRVRSYWQKRRPAVAARYTGSARPSTGSPTSSTRWSTRVSEALLLEANLIKRFQPRFNIRLKDDKSYPYIKITLGDDFPRIERTRKLPNDGSRYFGPYASASSRRRGDEPRPPAVPVPDLHDRHQGRRAGPRPAVPAVPHQALPGPVHRGRSRRPTTGATSARWSCSSRAARTRWSTGLRARDGRRGRGAASTSGRPSSATRSGRSSGRWRARRWPRSRGPSWTSSGSPARTTRRPSSCSSIRNGKMLGRDVFLLDAPRRRGDDEVLGSFLEQYYARATSDPAARSSSRARSPTPPTSRRS